MRKFIRLNNLRPLDVILSKPIRSKNNITSDAIAFLTSKGKTILSKYSHASIAITPFSIFESGQDGINFSRLNPTKCLADKKNGITLLKDASDYEHIAIYRHSGLSGISPDAIIENQKKMLDAMFEYYLLEYPSITELKSYFKDRSIRTQTVDLIMGKFLDLYGKRQEKFATGPFCSQLICELFNDLDIKLFNVTKNIDFNKVAPIDLSFTKLTLVEDAVIDETKISENKNETTLLQYIEEASQLFNMYQDLFSDKNRQYQFLFVNLIGKVIEPLLGLDNISKAEKLNLERIWNKKDAEKASVSIKAFDLFSASIVADNHTLSTLKLLSNCFTNDCKNNCLNISDCILAKDGLKKANQIQHDKIHDWASNKNGSTPPPFNLKTCD